MLPPKLLLLSLALFKLIAHLDAKRCPKGHRTHEGRCAPCPNEYYQPQENDSTSCKPCSRCSPNGSFAKDVCTRYSNTKCECYPGFVSWEPGSITCYCDKGFGKNNKGFGNNNQTCVECGDGYFNNKKNSPCQKWKECKSGIKTPGTTTSDVVCNDPGDDVVSEHLLTRLTSLRPREEPQTWSALATTTTATTASPQHRGPTKTNEAPTPPSNTDYANYIGMALLIFGTVGLLMLTAVTCKLHISPCLQKKMPETYNECRQPVEESGDGSLSILKHNAEEP